MNDQKAADLAKSNVIQDTLLGLFHPQFKEFNEKVNSFIKSIEPYDAFHIYGKTFNFKYCFELDGTPTKTLWITEESKDFEEAASIYVTNKNLRTDYGLIEHFIGLFLNKCPNMDEFFVVFSDTRLQHTFENLTPPIVYKNFKKNIYRAITHRQNIRPTKPHQYEIFLNDHEYETNLVNKYFIDNLLLG